jgi:hypothetical protein
MTNMPVTHPASRSVASAFHGSGNATSAANRLGAAMADPNLLIVLAFSAIGLFVTLDLIFTFRELVPGFAQAAQFLS